jgi:hypothetical protein
MKSGAERIAAERKRQIEKEGWTSGHDDKHKGGQLAFAAAAYATPTIAGQYTNDNRLSLFLKTTWSLKWWKPTPDDRIRELEKAGALIATEIDRLQRLEAKKGAES